MKYRFLILVIFICSTLFFVQGVSSQTSDINLADLIDSNTGLPTGIDEQVSIEQIPKIPKPGQTVSVRITAYTTNLNKAKITWSQDGKIILSQTGAVTNQIQAPESGKQTTVTITIVKEGGGTLVKTITLNPADVDLIYEAQTYAHPLFKGKRLFSSESVVNFIAVPNFVRPNGTKIPDNELVYTWKINGSVEQSVSGYGKNTFISKGTLIERGTQVTVDVSAINSNLVATQSISLRSIAPETLVYENNPLLGVVYERAVNGTFYLERPQVDFEAIPYFFSANTKDSNELDYKWSINGVRVSSKQPTENYLLLRNDKNTEGRATISATVSHVQNLLQTSMTRLGLDFKKVANTSNEEFTF